MYLKYVFLAFIFSVSFFLFTKPVLVMEFVHPETKACSNRRAKFLLSIRAYRASLCIAMHPTIG